MTHEKSATSKVSIPAMTTYKDEPEYATWTYARRHGPGMEYWFVSVLLHIDTGFTVSERDTIAEALARFCLDPNRDWFLPTSSCINGTSADNSEREPSLAFYGNRITGSALNRLPSEGSRIHAALRDLFIDAEDGINYRSIYVNMFDQPQSSNGRWLLGRAPINWYGRTSHARIALNRAAFSGWSNDPDHWIPVIVHELLHNLGWSHPPAIDPSYARAWMVAAEQECVRSNFSLTDSVYGNVDMCDGSEQ